jgi:NitT/TauT family transport system permease protein
MSLRDVLNGGLVEPAQYGREFGRDISAKIKYRALFVVSFLFVWQISAMFLTAELLPTPVDTLESMVNILENGDFLFHMFHTVRRVAIPFAAAWMVSVAIGVWMGLSQRVERFFDIGIVIGLTIPGLAWAIISIMFFGLSPLSAYFAVFIIVLPIITINFWEGVKDIDMELTEMAQVFNFSRSRTIRRVLLPQLYPYMFSAGRFGLGLAWKVVVLVEFLGMGNGIGFEIGTAYNNFAMADVLAWVGLFTFIMLVVEYGGFKYLEERYLSWRPDVGIQKTDTHA